MARNSADFPDEVGERCALGVTIPAIAAGSATAEVWTLGLSCERVPSMATVLECGMMRHTVPLALVGNIGVVIGAVSLGLLDTGTDTHKQTQSHKYTQARRHARTPHPRMKSTHTNKQRNSTHTHTNKLFN